MRKTLQAGRKEEAVYGFLGSLAVGLVLWVGILCVHIGFEVWVEALRMAGVVSSVEEAFREGAVSGFHTLMGFVLVFGKSLLVIVLLALAPLQVCRLGGFVSVGKRLSFHFKKRP